MKDMLKPLAKSVLITVGLTAAASVTDVPIFQKIFGSGMSTSMISNKEMNGITRIVQSLEEYGLLVNGVNETINNEAKEQKGRLFGMLLYTLGAKLLENQLSGKSIIREDKDKGTIRAAKDFQCL